jgi:hypothetical protein
MPIPPITVGQLMDLLADHPREDGVSFALHLENDWFHGTRVQGIALITVRDGVPRTFLFVEEREP